MTDDELRQEFAKIGQRFDEVDQNIAGVKTELKADITSVKTEVAGVKADVAVLDTRVKTITEHLGIGDEIENVRTVERARGSGPARDLPRAAKGDQR